MMRILQVAHNFVSHSRGGVEVYTHDLSRALLDLGAEVVVAFPEERSGEPASLRHDAIGDLELRAISIPEHERYGLRRRDPAVEEVFARLLEEERFDVVHFQHTHIGLPFSLLPIARGSGARVCLTLHDTWFACARTHMYVPESDALCPGPTPEICARCVSRIGGGEADPRTLDRLGALIAERLRAAADAIAVCDVVTAPTRWLIEALGAAGLPTADVELSRLGLRPPAPVTHAPGAGVRFGFLGNLTRLKNPVRLARAFSGVRGDATLEIAGAPHPDTRDALAEVAAADPRIRLHGAYGPDDLGTLLGAIDVLVLPSRTENYPLVAREALAAGIPVLASRTGGLGEIVEHGRNGLLFDATSEPEMREVMQALLDSPALRERLGAGIGPVKRIETDAREWMGRYEALLRPRIAVDPGLQPCSVVIPVYNRVDLTRQCLESLLSLRDDRPAELIVSDDASSDETAAYLASLGDAVRVLRAERNGGFARSCNAGAAVATQPAIVLLNNDTIPLRGWLRALLAELEDPVVGIVGSKLLYPDGTIQHAGVAFGRMTALPYHLYAGVESSAPFVNRRRELRAVTAACMLVRRDAWSAVDGLDPGYLNGFEDIDLCLRAAREGWRIVYQPRSQLFHLESQSPGRSARELANVTRFQERWGDVWRVDEDLLAFEDGLEIAARHVRELSRETLEPRRTLAELQRLALAGDRQAVREYLLETRTWPIEHEALVWVGRICAWSGARELEECFYSAAAPLPTARELAASPG